MTSTSRPVHVAMAPVTATPTPWGDRISEAIPATLTSGAFASFHVFASPSTQRPAYVHHVADEAFVVLSGTVTFTVATRRPPADLGPGAAIYVPRGLRRSFRAGPSGAWLLVTQTPGRGLDGVRELLSAAAAGPTPETFRQLAGALSGHGIELVPSRSTPTHPSEGHP